MENNWVTNNRRTILRILLLALAAFLLYALRKDLISTLMPFLYATILAFIINPLINSLEKRGVSRSWSSLISVLLLLLILLTMLLFFVPRLVGDLSTLLRRLTGGMGNLSKLLDSLTEQLDQWLSGTIDLEAKLEELMAGGMKLLTTAITRAIASLGKLLDVLLLPVITYYLLKDKDKILASMLQLFKPSQRKRMQRLARDIRRLLGGYVKGKIIISAFVGLMTGLGCLLIGLPNALSIGLVAGLFDLIPYFGPWLGGILPMLIALMGSQPIKALWVLILILIIQQVESNLITPRIISHRVGMHPLLVMFSVLFFGAVMGIPGMILGVPAMAVLIKLLQLARRAELGEDDGLGGTDEAPAEGSEPAVPAPEQAGKAQSL